MGEIPSQEEPSVHVDTDIYVETVEIPVHDVDIHIEGQVIDVPDKDIKISVVDGVTIEEELPTQEEPSVHIDTDIHVEGVLPAEDGEKKTKVKKMKVKKEKKPKEKKEKQPKEKREKKKKDKDINISVVDGVTIAEDIPTQDEPSVHIDTDIHVKTVEIPVPDGHIHIEGPVIDVPKHTSDSSSSSSSESDGERVLP